MRRTRRSSQPKLRPEEPHAWQRPFYDFNLWSERKRIEKLHYIHRYPVRRGLVKAPEDWKWSSSVHYAMGMEGIVEIESQWTARRREQLGVVLLEPTLPAPFATGWALSPMLHVSQPRGMGQPLTEGQV